MLLQPTLLSIAGSDPSGGAGIQADLKTMTSIGVYGAAAITCLTIQNSRGVSKVQSLDPEFVTDQIQAVLSDHNVTHIKIGMTGSRCILHCLAEILHSFPGELIYDPVLAATTGESLLEDGGVLTLEEKLLPQVSYLTPNTSELQFLSRSSISSQGDAIHCARLLLKKYSEMKAIVVKGGHLEESSPVVCDFLVQSDKTIYEAKRPRQWNPNLHGTGCTYSSALASYLCMGHDIVTAFLMTGRYMDNIISCGQNSSASTSPQNGPLLHFML